MKLNKKKKLIILILAVISLGAFLAFLVLGATGGKKANIIKILPGEADVRIEDFVFTEVGRDNMRWEVKSNTAQYEKKHNLAIFDQVWVKLTAPDGKVFVMTGDRGEMLTDKKDLEITGHVVITADSGEKFSTDYLKYSDSMKKIYTDAPVVMESERIRVQGVGLSIFVDKGELALSSDVKASIR